MAPETPNGSGETREERWARNASFGLALLAAVSLFLVGWSFHGPRHAARLLFTPAAAPTASR